MTDNSITLLESDEQQTQQKRRQVLAWCVHLYTMTGGVIAVFALLAAARSETSEAFLLLVITMLIDATDGMMARRLRIWELLPKFSGAQVDDIIDSFTFIWIGIFIMGYEKLLPHPAWLIVPVLAGLYAYGQTEMKTPDNFFLGFPSYWTTITMYMWWLKPAPIPAVLMVVIPAVLSAIPTRYLYPSKSHVLWKTSWGLGIPWFLLIVYLLGQSDVNMTLVWLSLYYPVYYLLASFYIDWRIRTGQLQLNL